MGDDSADQIAYGTDILYIDTANGEEELQKYIRVWELYAQNQGTERPIVTDNNYGYNCTAVSPVLDENGQAIALGIICIVLLVYMLLIQNIVLRPIEKLAHFTGRIGAELNVATQIQSSMLPCIFLHFRREKNLIFMRP